jgi:simple sugar transport system ATP-binding protein
MSKADDSAPAAGPRLALQAATRRFGDLVAVDTLDFTLKPGRLHALIGENGAGKSTAMKMLAGVLEASSGRVLVEGAELSPATPQEAMHRGIGMVHQHFMLVEAFSAIENLVLGAEPVSGAAQVLDLTTAAERARRIGQEAGLMVDLDAPTALLSVGEQQRLEILRVLFRGARAILLDEPTAVLSPVEVDELYRTLRQLADGGATIAVVTHRLDEVVRFCDDVTVMRQGKRVLSEALSDKPRVIDEERDAETDAALSERLTRAIMGGEVPDAAEPPERPAKPDVVLSIGKATVLRANGRKALDGLSLDIEEGEVVGVAGVEGNGQEALTRALAGLAALEEGDVRLEGERLFAAEPGGYKDDLRDHASAVHRAMERGLVVVHADRHRDELLLDATVSDNLVLGDLGEVDEGKTVDKRFARFDPIRHGWPQSSAAAISRRW